MLYVPCIFVWFQFFGKNCSENEKIIVILVLCVNMDKPKRHSGDGKFFSHWCIIPHLPTALMVNTGSEHKPIRLTVFYSPMDLKIFFIKNYFMLLI